MTSAACSRTIAPIIWGTKCDPGGTGPLQQLKPSAREPLDVQRHEPARRGAWRCALVGLGLIGAEITLWSLDQHAAPSGGWIRHGGSFQYHSLSGRYKRASDPHPHRAVRSHRGLPARRDPLGRRRYQHDDAEEYRAGSHGTPAKPSRGSRRRPASSGPRKWRAEG